MPNRQNLLQRLENIGQLGAVKKGLAVCYVPLVRSGKCIARCSCITSTNLSACCIPSRSCSTAQHITVLYSVVHDCTVLWLEYSTPVQYSSTGNSEGKTHH